MKKLFISIVLLLVLVFAASVAEPLYIGSWANVHETENSETKLTAFRLFPDHSVAYISQQFPDGSPFTGVFLWEEADGGFKIVTNDGQTLGEYFPLNKNRAEDKSGNMFVKISFEIVSEPTPKVTASPEPEDSEKEKDAVSGNLRDGLLIYPGQYIIGTDIPAGDYRFEYYEAPVDIFVRKDPESAMWSAFASVSKKSPVFAKINLPEGGRLDIGAFPVIIMYAKPLNLGE